MAMLSVFRLETVRPGSEDNGILAVSGGNSTESRLASQGQAAWAASGVLGILKDLGYVPQVDFLGDVMGKEVGEAGIGSTYSLTHL